MLTKIQNVKMEKYYTPYKVNGEVQLPCFNRIEFIPSNSWDLK